MDSENKQRISLYLDRDTVKKADKMMKEYGFKSRNEFYTAAVESFIADELLQKKRFRSVGKVGESGRRAIGKQCESNLQKK